MSNKPSLSGIIPPILTPTDAHDNVDEKALRGHIDWLIARGVTGLFVSGSAGEGPILTDREWTRLAEIVFDQAKSRVPCLLGVQDSSTRRVLDKVRIAREIGYPYYVCTPTYYIPCRTHSEQLRLFSACVEAAGDMELVAYNIPQLTNSTVSVDTFCDLARRGWIHYCKESSGNMPFLTDLITRGREVGLHVLMGDEANAANGLLAGAVGLVNLCGNIEPATYVKLCEAVKRHDKAGAEAAQARINEIVRTVVLNSPSFVAGPKYVLAKRGFGIGRPLSPGEPISDAEKKVIDAFVEASPK